MNKEYITIRIEKEIKEEIDRIKHAESVIQNGNLNSSDTLKYIIDTYYRYKDLEY